LRRPPVVLLALFAVVCACNPASLHAQAHFTPGVANIRDYAMPDQYLTMYAFSIDKNNPQYKGPFNSILNFARVFTPEDTAFVTPNSDTPYTFLGPDLRAEPVVITIPPMEKNRYFAFQMLDLYTFNFDYVGTRTTGNGGGNFMVAGPGWHGEVPKRITKVIHSETELVSVVGRTQLFNPADLDNVKKIQSQYKVQTLSGFLGTPALPAAPTPNWVKPILPTEMKTRFAAVGQTPPSQPSSPRHAAAPALQLAPWSGDFDGMLKRRFIRVLVASSKTEYYVVNGVQHGSSYEFLKAFEQWVNQKYPQKDKSLRFHVVFVPVSRDQIFPRLTAGRGDLAVGTLAVTPERSKIVDFSDPLVTGVKEIAVTGPNSPELHSLEDLSSQEVFVRKSSSHWEHLEALNQKFRSEGKAVVKLRAAPEDLEDEDLLEMLNAGLVPIVVTDAYLPRIWQQFYTSIKPNPDVVLNDSLQIAWAMRKNSPKLAAAVNEFVKTHKQGTAFGNSVIARYAQSPKMLKNAVTPGELKKFQATATMFQKYSSTYNLDYLLMMAQGYQESTLDQNAKSQVGAIGVMQLMPPTGDQMKVGDIHQEEANIHAGVKYIRFMVDRYFANEPMDDTNKILFAFAAYNAGPGRVHSLRAEAAKKGLNPNVWIDNVELVAAARIGMETVTYVANIYKYYVAYKLVAQREEERKKAKEAVENGP
jgi:membrane-bound lytic murein transglycosylase MltF